MLYCIESLYIYHTYINCIYIAAFEKMCSMGRAK